MAVATAATTGGGSGGRPRLRSKLQEPSDATPAFPPQCQPPHLLSKAFQGMLRDVNGFGGKVGSPPGCTVLAACSCLAAQAT